MTQRPNRLLEQAPDAIRLKHYAHRTEKTHAWWAKTSVVYHDKQHPCELADKEITEFLTCLAVDQNMSPSTQNQALSRGTSWRAPGLRGKGFSPWRAPMGTSAPSRETRSGPSHTTRARVGSHRR
jgi:hypothetical protein